MRVLVVDPDEGLARQVGSLIGPAGFDVVHAASPGQVDAYLRIGGVRAVVVDLSRRRIDGFSVARTVRAQHPASELEIVLVTPHGGGNAAEVADLRTATKARFVLERPVELNDVLVAVNTPLPPAKPAETAMGGVMHRKDGHAAGRTDSRRHRSAFKTNRPKRLRIDWSHFGQLTELWLNRKSGTIQLEGSDDLFATLSDGGLVDASRLGVLKRLLAGRSFRYTEQAVDEPGHWADLGAFLFQAAKASSDSRTLHRYAAVKVETNPSSPMARLLPLDEDARRFVRSTDGKRTVQDLADASRVSIGDVSASIVALVHMGLFSIVGFGDAKPVGSRYRISHRVPLKANGDQSSHAVDDGAALHKRLLREVETVSTAAPAVVLGVPADAERTLVDEAAQRMRSRYIKLSNDQGLSAEDRSLAKLMVRNVDRAYKAFHAGDAEREQPMVPLNEVEQWLNEGKQLLVDQKWAEADNVLSQAHTKEIDNARVMANLGWARLHNPEIDIELRTEEGQDLLLLAEQFDPTDSDGQFYLAQVLMAADQVDAAELRAARAVGAEPDDTRRRTLLRKIRLKRRDSSGASG